MKIIFTLVALTFTTQVFAQTSDSFLLRGTVAKVCDVAVTADAAATALDLTSAGHSNTLVASIVSSTNSISGMRLDINGDTASELVHTTAPANTIAYTLDYTATTTSNDAAGISVVVAPAALDNIASNGPLNGTLGINITADPSLVDGDYEANVTIACVTL